jgi:predicted nucleotidyltransferase
MDNKTKTGKADDSRINVNESYELQYWSQKLNVTREKLKEAVEAVGPSAEKVTEYLKRK